MGVVNLPPPRRFVVSEDEDQVNYLVEVTGTEDLIYIVGIESPWLGVSLDEIEKNMLAGYYGPHIFRLEHEIARARAGETFFEKDDE